VQRKALADRLQACISGQIKAAKTRYHGDYHLGQVLLTQNDFVITDFEASGTSVRRASPQTLALRDVPACCDRLIMSLRCPCARQRGTTQRFGEI